MFLTITLELLSLKALPKTVLGKVCLVERLCAPKPDFLHLHLSKTLVQLARSAGLLDCTRLQAAGVVYLSGSLQVHAPW